jgi:hypothetical protein
MVEQLVDTNHVEAVATSLYQSKLRAAGLPGTAKVDCGARRIVALAPKATIVCSLAAGNAAPRVLLVRATDQKTLQFDVPPRPRV